jgi:hypothetical protein
MRKTKLVVRVATLILSVLAVAGIMILIFDNSNTQRTVYELIAFVIGICAVAMAVLEQIHSRRLERRLDRMQDEVLVLLKEAHEDQRDDKYIRAKLREILNNQKKNIKIS